MYLLRFKSLLSLVLALVTSTILFAAIPSGYYYFAKNKKQAALKTALHIYASPMTEFDYGGGPGFTWEGFFYTDQKADGSVIDMYSNTVRKFNGFNAVSGMHIEHSFPKSWWGAYPNNAYKDLFHLYPADAVTNITKSNLPLGEVIGTPTLDNGVTKIGANGFETAYTDNCFEPSDEFKGDFARSYFYISTIYEDYAPLWASPMLNNNTYPVWKPWALDLLLKWHRQDPVSPKELARIEAIYNIQGNRNPFIDYPDLVEYIWGADTTKVYPFPEETEPFLLTPRRGATMDFGVILVNDSRVKNIHLQGVNINADVLVSLLRNNTSLTLSTPSIAVSDALNGIDLSLTFNPITSGSIRDTLLVQGGGLTESLRIPIKALASADFITLEPTDIKPVGGTLQWISDPQATDYHLNVYKGDKQAGDLIISSYVEGSSWNKALELYNGTGKAIDLSRYMIQKQSDGAGNFGSTIHLTGTLQNNQTYVIVNNNKLTNVNLQAKAQLLDSLINFNGNDAAALLRSGVIIDMVGPANTGASVIWGMDMTLQRKPDVTHPISTFNPSEWITLPIDTYSNLGSHIMSLLVTTDAVVLIDVLTGKTTSYPVQNLLPENTYTYRVEAIKAGGNTTAINTMQLHTLPLDVPILMQATDIHTTDFKANWEETLYATGYLLNVFEVTGQADTTVIEGFDNVGTSGTPLPTGWTGTASGNYTSSTSYGIASPSLYFKNAGEWVQTKTYPQSVSNLKFMYRFGTSVVGASLIIDGQSNSSWIRIDSIPCKNNNKAYPIYNFNTTQTMTAFRFTFNKLPGGNFNLDDVSATYGNQDTIFVQKDKAVSATQTVVSGLKENTSYFYNVRATLGTAVSLPSETIGVGTLVINKVPDNNASFIKIISKNDHISISGLRGDELIHVYSLTGICMKQVKANDTQMDVTIKQNGIFIIRIQNKEYSIVYKIIK
ncbi:MAG TPA: endonuclease [Paludibacter sp.]